MELPYEASGTIAAPDAKLEGNKLTCRAVASRDVNALMIVVTYDSDGRAMEVKSKQVSLLAGVACDEYAVTLRAAYRYRVYLIDATTFAPLGKCWDYHN
ncbi:MAG: hypothetical protein IJU66_05200 [Oscillospiraceae bacterium]|nr:hypothetical protein [Oscillospiraceae bacterium]